MPPYRRIEDDENPDGEFFLDREPYDGLARQPPWIQTNCHCRSTITKTVYKDFLCEKEIPSNTQKTSNS
jgi:hypothetical protein